MLITIGQKRPAACDLGGLLLECHERIRSFVELARVAAEQMDLPRHRDRGGLFSGRTLLH